MKPSMLWWKATAVVAIVAVVTAGVIWFAPLSELRFELTNPESEPATIGIFIDPSRLEPGAERLTVELGPGETVNKSCHVGAGKHVITIAWGFSTEGPSAEYSHTTRPLTIDLKHFETEEIRLTIF